MNGAAPRFVWKTDDTIVFIHRTIIYVNTMIKTN